MANKKFTLGICEIFNPKLHGFTNNSSPYITSHYLVHKTIDLDEFFTSSYDDCLENLFEFYYHHYHYYRRATLIEHPIIRNYHHILNNIDFIKVDIIEIFDLPGNEQVACIKTFWLKLLQRKWKRIYNDRQNKMRKLKKPRILFQREITGIVK